MFLTLSLCAGLAYFIYLFLTWNYGYWKKRGVPGPKPKLLLGSYPNMFCQKRNLVEDIDDIYRTYKKDYDFVGIYSSRSPQLLVLSPALMHRVFVTDFKHFHDNEASLIGDRGSESLFRKNPFMLCGQEWKDIRAEISPGLTQLRIKAVYPVTRQVCGRLSKCIENQIRIAPKEGTDAKDMCLRYTSEIVTDCVLGLRSDSFSDRPSPIIENINKLFGQSFFLLLYLAVTNFLPIIRKFYKLDFVPKDVTRFFCQLLDDAVNVRRKQLEENDKSLVDRIDFMNYLLELQKKKGLQTSDLTAHTMTFLLDGYETTAAVLAHTLYFLGLNQDKQEKLYQEIKKYLGKNGEIEFERLNDLPYLEACIHETIRIYPPGIMFSKLCTLPLDIVNKDGKTLHLEKGDVVILPAFSIMHDEEYYPQPLEYIPERFSDDPEAMKNYREKGLYYGFGDGPRICLGMRFALAQMKAALVEILFNFVVKTNPKTRRDFKLDPKYFMSQVLGGIWLDFEKREQNPFL